MVLILFAFIGGIITVLSPCILPLLPIILSSTVGGGKRRPLGIVAGFIASFTFFTLFLSAIVQATGVPPNTLRDFSIIILVIFGLTLIVPQLQAQIEKLFVMFQRFGPTNSQNKTGFGGGLIIGVSLGLLWTPCVGPILASVISLALSGTVTGSAFLITLAYSTGTAIPMLGILYGGQTALTRVPWLTRNSGKIQRAFGVLMIITAISIFFNVDRQFQSYILEKFPNYGTGLTAIEDNQAVKDALNQSSKSDAKDMQGKPMNELTDQMNYPMAPEIIPGGQWFGSTPLTIKSLRGKVVLVDFWTYSCINCIRTLPYLHDWYAKYKDDGFVIIGVHTPEFEFEKDPANVAKALKDFDIQYPVVQDNNYATWNAYNNHYWPAKYLIDKDGRIRFTHFGEGEYDTFEKHIQDLLKETGQSVNQKIDNAQYQIYAGSPETYIGYLRSVYNVSPEKVVKDAESTYTIPNILPQNSFALSGTWDIMGEYAGASEGAALALHFSAKEVYLVMRTTSSSTRAKIYLDDKVVDGNSAGDDVKDGIVTIDQDRLYNLINLTKPGEHTVKIEFLDDGGQVYAFTFG